MSHGIFNSYRQLKHFLFLRSIIYTPYNLSGSDAWCRSSAKKIPAQRHFYSFLAKYGYLTIFPPNGIFVIFLFWQKTGISLEQIF